MTSTPLARKEPVDHESNADVAWVLAAGRSNLLHDLRRRDAHAEDGGCDGEYLEHPAVHEEHDGAGPADAVVAPTAGDDGARERLANDVEADVRQAGHHVGDRARQILTCVRVTHRSVLIDIRARTRLERGNAQERLLTGRPSPLGPTTLMV
jgi:hypothetical protein